MRVLSERQLAVLLGALAGPPRVVAGGNFATPWRALSVLDGAVARYHLFALNAQPGLVGVWHFSISLWTEESVILELVALWPLSVCRASQTSAAMPIITAGQPSGRVSIRAAMATPAGSQIEAAGPALVERIADA